MGGKGNISRRKKYFQTIKSCLATKDDDQEEAIRAKDPCFPLTSKEMVSEMGLHPNKSVVFIFALLQLSFRAR